MPIRSVCPKCQKRLKAGDEQAGKTLTCPTCSTPVAVPAMDMPSAPLQEETVDPNPISVPNTTPAVSGGDIESVPPNIQSAEPKTMPCPMCGEIILAVAKKCKHCKALLAEQDDAETITDEKKIAEEKSKKIAGGCCVGCLGFIVLALIVGNIPSCGGSNGKYERYTETQRDADAKIFSRFMDKGESYIGNPSRWTKEEKRVVDLFNRGMDQHR